MHVSVSNASKAYWHERALDKVSFEIEPGQVVAVLGTNGAGKTTLLRALAGLVKLDKGEIFYDQQRFSRSRIDLRRQLHFLPDFPPLVGAGNILRQAALVMQAYGREDESAVEKFIALLQEFHLLKKIHVDCSDLSRGQIYKMALSIALAIDPALQLYDEPFASGMDPLGIASFRQHTRDAANRGQTIIYTTQILELAESFSDSVCILHEGRLHAFGPLSQFRSLGSTDGSAAGVLADVFTQLRSPDDPAA